MEKSYNFVSGSSAATTSKPKPSVTCLFMVDLQSLNISTEAIKNYTTYWNFAMTVASKLNDASTFTGYPDSFGYASGLNDHSKYPVNNYTDFKNVPMPVEDLDDGIDLDLKDVDSTLTQASWMPLVQTALHQTCLIFFSAAPEAEFGSTTINSTYVNFTTVIGVRIGDATSIPGITDPVNAQNLDDAEAQSVVQKLLDSLP
ncbi:hypothetical protein L3Y34_010305 [Caenorhabditis briggsae]|uniref:Uncharacterized protein n=1 Tax=Caenorhabditis briggsae TaxID=6238 RepID=A0AAE9CSW0_CAEBR|nr:hypothetical protein L3Y34_010305 [Caenorhabditis briggsae]